MVIIVSVLKLNEFLWLDGFKLMNFLSEKAADHRVVPSKNFFFRQQQMNDAMYVKNTSQPVTPRRSLSVSAARCPQNLMIVK